MKTAVRISMIDIMSIGLLQADRVHRYGLKSGRMTYGITGLKEIKALGLKESISLTA